MSTMYFVHTRKPSNRRDVAVFGSQASAEESYNEFIVEGLVSLKEGLYLTEVSPFEADTLEAVAYEGAVDLVNSGFAGYTANTLKRHETTLEGDWEPAALGIDFDDYDEDLNDVDAAAAELVAADEAAEEETK